MKYTYSIFDVSLWETYEEGISLKLNVLCLDVLLFIWNSMKQSILYTKNNIMWWITEIFTNRKYEIHYSSHVVALMVIIFCTGQTAAGDEYICLTTVPMYSTSLYYSVDMR